MVWLLLGYMCLFVHRPFEIKGWEILADIRLERMYMLVTLLAVAAWPGKRWLNNRLNWTVLGFALAVLVCWLASPWAAAGDGRVEDFFKILVFYVLLLLVIHDEPSLKRLLWGFLAVLAVYMTHSLVEYGNGRHMFRMGIPRMIGVDQTMGDPNSFGATLVYSLPFVVPLWAEASKARRWLLGGYVSLVVLCVGLTGSRSAFVSLVLAAVLVVMRSRGRWRLAVMGMVAAPVLFALLPMALQTRFETIIDPSVGPANAQESAEGRVQGLLNGWRLWSENPVTGCGPGAWRPATHSPIESHNLYGQVMGELGTLGIVAFAAFLVCFWANVRWIRKTYRNHPEWGQDFLYRTTQAVSLGVLLLLFEGNFGHNLFRYNWYWYGAFLIVVGHCVQQRLQQQWLGEVYADAAEDNELVSVGV
jgi:O-antigen ligase